MSPSKKLLFVQAFLACFYFANSFAETAKVTRVVDGDTVILDRIGRARLIGVDTPETVHPQKPVQFFGKEASNYTRSELEGKTVRVEYDWQKKDRYNRTLVYLFLQDGTFFNAELIKQGYGHAYTNFPFKYLDEFRGYERAARENNRGLWGTKPKEITAEAKVEQDTLVYITRAGKKYHLGSCRYLRRSKIPTTLKLAAGRYGPCSVCNPPSLSVVPLSSRSNTVKSTPSYRGRCQATTRKGTQCKRNAQAERLYCWQH